MLRHRDHARSIRLDDTMKKGLTNFVEKKSYGHLCDDKFYFLHFAQEVRGGLPSRLRKGGLGVQLYLNFRIQHDFKF